MSSRPPATDAPLIASSARALPYVLSWAVLAALMIIGMNCMPLVLYVPIDGEWAKWNVEAILHFGRSSISVRTACLPEWARCTFRISLAQSRRPGARSPARRQRKEYCSYAVYAIELAVSVVLLARAIGFSWLMATAAAQLYLYLLFPPFSQVFRIYDWYSLAPYFAHLTSVLNAASVVFLACGRIRDWRGNVGLSVGFLALFISGLLSAPFTFIFASPAYIAICAAIVLARRPPRVEWAWKAAALLICLIFFWLRPPRLLSRYHRHGRPYPECRDRVGPSPVAGRLAAIVSGASAVPGSKAPPMHQGSGCLAGDCRARRSGGGHPNASRRHPGRGLGPARLYRSRARLRLRLSGRMARSGERPLQSFSDFVVLVFHLYVCGASVLRAVAPDQGRNIRENGGIRHQGTSGLRREYRRRRPARPHRHQHASSSIRHPSLSRRSTAYGYRGLGRAVSCGRNDPKISPQGARGL